MQPPFRTSWLIAAVLLVLMMNCAKKVEMITPPLKIVFFGDSITFGYGVGLNGKSFYSRIENIMRAGVYDNVVTVNAGVNGDDSFTAIARIGDVTAMKPDIIIFAFGLNDCQTQNISPDSYRKNLVRMISFMPPETRIVLATSNTFMDTGQDLIKRLNKELDIYMNEVRVLAREKGYKLIDVNDVWKEHLRLDSRSMESLYVDPTHPSEKGHALIFETYMNVLRNMIMQQ